jgi:hypothetical protein
MTDRRTELKELADRISEYDSVTDAWLAKSFTDRLLVVDVRTDQELPPAVERLLAEHGLRGAHEVYETDGPDSSFMGGYGDASRHQFVDIQTRGDHQSYVLE